LQSANVLGHGTRGCELLSFSNDADTNYIGDLQSFLESCCRN